MPEREPAFRVIDTSALLRPHKREIVRDLLRLRDECGVTDVAFMMPLQPEERSASLVKSR